MKVARTVLNGESGSNAADLHNSDMVMCMEQGINGQSNENDCNMYCWHL